MWLALLASAVILAGAGIFFAVQSLGRADQYASVASFFVALLTAIASALALLRSRSKPRITEGSENKPLQSSSRPAVFNFAWRNKAVQYGPRSTMNITEVAKQKSRKDRSA